MERSFADDIKVALFVLAGSALGYLIFGPDLSVLLGAVLGVAIMILVLNVLRRVTRRRSS
jgi:uncharacterized membrane protein YccC